MSLLSQSSVVPVDFKPLTTAMDNSNKLPPCSHHHHQQQQCLEVSPHCPQHSNYYFSHPNTPHHHHLNVSPACPLHGHLLPFCPLHSSSNTHYPPNPNFNSLQLQPQPMIMQDMNEEADDEEFTYVLTDEWKEFFAKSESKRKLAKKQAKKKGKD